MHAHKPSSLKENKIWTTFCCPNYPNYKSEHAKTILIALQHEKQPDSNEKLAWGKLDPLIQSPQVWYTGKNCKVTKYSFSLVFTLVNLCS